MTMPWEKPSDDGSIPAVLKRDANNVAPFMREQEDAFVAQKQEIKNELQYADFPWKTML